MLYAGISRNYEALGKHEEAIRYSQKAIQVLSDNDPGLSYLYETMANNYMGLKQYLEAIKHFSRVLELDPKFERREGSSAEDGRVLPPALKLQNGDWKLTRRFWS